MMKSLLLEYLQPKTKATKNGSSSFPVPPIKNLLSHFSMNAEKYTPQEKNCNNDDEFDQNDSTTEVSIKKPKILSSEIVSRKVIVKAKSPSSKKNEDSRIKDQENRNSAGTGGDNLKKKVPRIPLKTITNQQDNAILRPPGELENVSGIQTQNAVVIAVNNNLQVVNSKLNILIDNQQQIITNQAKERILGTAGRDAQSDRDGAWNEKKRVMTEVFKKMSTLVLFLEFDKELKNSETLRARVRKYVHEKVVPQEWKISARDMLNAVVHLDVQVQYSMFGRKGKRVFRKTTLFTLLRDVVQQVSKIDGKITASERAIGTYYSDYLKGAPKRIKDRQARAKNGKSSTVALGRALLFGEIDSAMEEYQSQDKENDLKAANDGDVEDEIDISDEDKAEAKAMIDSIMSDSVSVDDDDGSVGSNNGEHNEEDEDVS